MRRLLALFIAMGLIAAAPEPYGQDYKQGKLGVLSDTIGTPRYDEVLHNPMVSEALQRLMGPGALGILEHDMQVRGPIAFDGECLILSGNAEHEGGSVEAVVAVRPMDGAVAAATLNGHSVRVLRPLDVHCRGLEQIVMHWPEGMPSLSDTPVVVPPQEQIHT